MTVTKRTNARLLVVDDHREMAQLLADQLQEIGYAVDVATSGADALAQVERRLPDVVVTDLRMERVDGLDVLEGIHKLDPALPVILMTAFGAVDTAIEAIRRGAFHYLTKPFPFDELLVHVERALAERQLREEHRALQQELQGRGEHQLLVGQSPAMEALGRLLARVAPSDAPVLILGESGSGKELVARTLHAGSPRRDRRFVAVNCAALPEALLESELFGHARGAFTGATGPRRGLFVEADGGTLFLDEIAEMPPALQAKLLRVIEDGEIRAVGADATRKVDVRLLAATHRNLETRVADGLFRADLFYRLHVVPVRVPPLRERPADIGLLVAFFLERERRTTPTAVLRQLAPDAIALLERLPWPGNVRELENLVRRLVLLSGEEIANAEDIRRLGSLLGAAPAPAPTLPEPAAPLPPPSAPEAEFPAPAPPAGEAVPSWEAGLAASLDRVLAPEGLAEAEALPTLKAMEQAYIAWVIHRCGGNKTRAAELLGIDVSTIHRRERRQR